MLILERSRKVGKWSSIVNSLRGKRSTMSTNFMAISKKKRRARQRINRLLGENGLVDKDMLRDKTVILVTDGFTDDLTSLDVALEFLKSIRTKKVVAVAPIATVAAVDRLHVAVDEMHILDVKANFMGVDHYYDNNTLPSREDTITKINQIILNWRLF